MFSHSSPFRKGLLFAWIPLVIFLLPLVIDLASVVSVNKATGVGAIAGGISESLVLLGFLSFIACETYAIALLAKACVADDVRSKALAVFSIVISSIFTGMFLVTLLLMLGHWFRSR